MKSIRANSATNLSCGERTGSVRDCARGMGDGILISTSVTRFPWREDSTKGERIHWRLSNNWLSRSTSTQLVATFPTGDQASRSLTVNSLIVPFCKPYTWASTLVANDVDSPRTVEYSPLVKLWVCPSQELTTVPFEPVDRTTSSIVTPAEV